MTTTETFDWTRLDEGWVRTEYGGGALERNGYQYYIETGAVTRWVTNANDPEAAFAFHIAAREQVAKCRVDWQQEVSGVMEACGLLGGFYSDNACLRVRHGRLIGLRCYTTRVFCWETVAHSGRYTEENVTEDITKLQRAAEMLVERGWRIE